MNHGLTSLGMISDDQTVAVAQHVSSAVAQVGWQRCGHVLLLNGWRIDTVTRSVTDGTSVARLSPRAVRLLQALAAAPGEAMSRNSLLDQVWPNVVVGDESLTQAVTEVRRVLGDPQGSKRLIETIPKYGYRLNARVIGGAEASDECPANATDRFDLRAYQLCLDARAVMSCGGPEAMSLPETLTAEAVALAPDFAFARAEHAIALSFRWLYQRANTRGLQRAFDHAWTATRIRPDQSGGFAALAFAYGAAGDHDRMRRALEQGLARDVNDAELQLRGVRTLYAAKDYRCAATLAERAAALDTEDFRPLFFGACAASFFDPDRKRRLARACLARIEARLAIDPADPRARHTRGPVLALLGLTDAAIDAVEAQDRDRSPCRFYDTITYSHVGDVDRAVEVFADVVEHGWRHLDWIAAEPTFDTLLSHPRFRRCARAIGLS